MSDLLIESSFHPPRAPHGIAHGCLPRWQPAMPPIQSQRTSNNFVCTVLFAYAAYTFHHPQLLSRPSAPTRDCPTDFLPWTSHCSRDRSRQPATSHGSEAHFTSSVKRRPGKRKTQIMATTTFDMTRKRQRLEADLAAMLATSTELHVIPEEESGLMNSSGQNVVKDEFKAKVEVEGLSGGEPFDLSGNLEELGGLNYGSYQTHPQDFTSDDNISGRPMKETRKRITPESRRPQFPTTSSIGAATQPVGPEPQGICCSPIFCSSNLKTTKVACLYFDRTFNQLLLSTGNAGFLRCSV